MPRGGSWRHGRHISLAQTERANIADSGDTRVDKTCTLHPKWLYIARAPRTICDVLPPYLTNPTYTHVPPSLYPNMMELWKDETGVAVSVADGRHSSWGTRGAAGLTNFVCRGKGPGGCWYCGCLWGGRPSSPSVSLGFVSSVTSL